MARNSSNNSKSKPATERVDFKGFVNLDLNTEEKKEVKAAQFGLEEAEDVLVKLVESGYKVTFNYDSFNQCYGVFVIPSSEKNINNGYILPGRGSTPLKALKQACYKHFNLLEGDWTEASIGKREALDD